VLDSPGIPGNTENVFASMGNYLFSTRTLLKALHEDAADEASSHDFGRDILPRMVSEQQAIYAYDFQTNKIPGEPPDMQVYWRDVGTTDAYWEANMDLRAVKPLLNLYNRQWPLRTSSFPDPPAKFTFDDQNRRGEAVDSIVSGGWIRRIERRREGKAWIGFFHLWTTDAQGRRVRTKKEKTLGPSFDATRPSRSWLSISNEYTGRVVNPGDAITTFSDLWTAFSGVKSGCWSKKTQEDLRYLFGKHVLRSSGVYLRVR
jgi:Nucleotidyl transferase